MHGAYAIAPLCGYVAAGAVKFAINSVRLRRPAVDRIGLGGFPSTHTTIVSTPVFLISMREGVDTAAFCVALTVALVVIIDATDLRRRIGEHARTLNALRRHDGPEDLPLLRERLGHSMLEVVGGVCTGFTVAALMFALQARG